MNENSTDRTLELSRVNKYQITQDQKFPDLYRNLKSIDPQLFSIYGRKMRWASGMQHHSTSSQHRHPLSAQPFACSESIVCQRPITRCNIDASMNQQRCQLQYNPGFQSQSLLEKFSRYQEMLRLQQSILPDYLQRSEAFSEIILESSVLVGAVGQILMLPWNESDVDIKNNFWISNHPPIVSELLGHRLSFDNRQIDNLVPVQDRLSVFNSRDSNEGVNDHRFSRFKGLDCAFHMADVPQYSEEWKRGDEPTPKRADGHIECTTPGREGTSSNMRDSVYGKKHAWTLNRSGRFQSPFGSTGQKIPLRETLRHLHLNFLSNSSHGQDFQMFEVGDETEDSHIEWNMGMDSCSEDRRRNERPKRNHSPTTGSYKSKLRMVNVSNHNAPREPCAGIEYRSGFVSDQRNSQQRSYQSTMMVSDNADINKNDRLNTLPSSSCHHDNIATVNSHQSTNILSHNQQRDNKIDYHSNHPSIICRSNLIDSSSSFQLSDLGPNFYGPGLYWNGWSLDDGRWTDPDGFITLSQKQRFKFHAWRRITDLDYNNTETIPLCVVAERPRSRYVNTHGCVYDISISNHCPHVQCP